MITRVTDNSKFSMITNGISTLQSQYGVMMEKLSTQKNINRPSDDPVGINNILNYNTLLTSIQQYQSNITDSTSWLNLTSTNIKGLRDIASEAQNIATSEAGAGGSPETRKASLSTLNSLIDEAISMLNAKSGDNYIFGGSATDIQPFSAEYVPDKITTASASASNNFDGTVASGGRYTGTTNNYYIVRMANASPGNLITAQYQVSTDGGENWSIAADFPAKTVQSNTSLTAGSSAITPTTVWNTIDNANVQNGTTVAITGTDHTGAPITPASFTITDASTGTVQDLLSAIENAFGNNVTASIDTNGKITVTDNQTGASSMTMSLAVTNPTGGSLSFGAVAQTTTATINVGNGITMTFAAGTKTLNNGDTFTVNGYAAGLVSSVSEADNNTYTGTVTSSGTYTGTENKNYALQIISSGNFVTAQYRVSSDGGATWGTTQNLPPKVIQANSTLTANNTYISSNTVWNTIDGANVQDVTVIAISGTNHTGNAVTGSYTITDASTGTVQDLLDAVESAFGNNVTASIDKSGRITVTDNTTGNSAMAMTLAVTNPSGGTLNFGAISQTTSTTVNVGDGITMTFSGSTQNLTAADIFTVNGYAAGYYRGNNDKLNAVVGKNNDMAYNITGAEAFTGQFASASVIDGTSGITADGSIVLSKGSNGQWSITTKTGYPNMKITSQTNNYITIDANNDGNDDITVDLTGPWNQNNSINLSLSAGISSGEIPTTFSGTGSVDLLSALNALKSALSESDQDRATKLIAAQIENLQNAGTQMLQYETQAGAKMKSMEVTGSNHDSMNLQITNMLADIENADMTKLITQYQLKQIAMEASYRMASQIGKMTIMDYL